MDDLRVETYGANEVAAKKQSISRRVALVGGAVVLTLGLFSLTGCVNDEEYVEEQTYQVEEQDLQDLRIPLGGSGSWYISVLERT